MIPLLRRALLIVLSALAGLGAGEAFCRLRGLPFPGFVERAMAGTPAIFELDSTLGWRLRPGRHLAFAGKRVTVLDDSSRDAGSAPGAAPDVIALGCSYTMGWGVSDEEAWVSRLQAAHPARAFRNYGTPGYGAFQSLLVLERELARQRPRLVLYGLIAHHEVRSHGDPAWSMMVSSMPIPDARAEAPFATPLPGGGLERHGPLALPAWPLEGESKVVQLAKLDWLRWGARGRLRAGREVTLRSIQQMRDEAGKAGARFAVVLLDLYGAAHDTYLAEFKARGIDYVDCASPDFLKPELRLPDHLHPNAAMHARYAACVSAWLDSAGERTP